MLARSQVKIMMDGQLLSVSTFHRIHLLGQEQPSGMIQHDTKGWTIQTFKVCPNDPALAHLPKSSSDLCGLLSRSRLELSRRSRSLSQSLSLSRLSCSLTALLLTDTGHSKVWVWELSPDLQNWYKKSPYSALKKEKKKKKFASAKRKILKRRERLSVHTWQMNFIWLHSC